MIQPAELVERIWERDPTVWTGHDEAQWVGWLDEPLRMRERVAELTEFAAGAAQDADDVVLLGMGGSSLAPEVLRRAFELERRFPDRFIPRYSMVMFHPEIPYAEAQRRGAIQARILQDLTASADSLARVDFARAAKLVDSLL